MQLFYEQVAFRSFKNLKLSEYPELKELWYANIGVRLFCNLRCLAVHKCKFLSNFLFSTNLLQELHALEELEVSDCDSLEAVFDMKVTDDKQVNGKETSQLKKLSLSSLPNLKHIWNMDPRGILCFRNLQDVKVIKCQNLMHLFSVSLCQDLGQLEVLTVESCGVKEIVAIEEGLDELKFEFPQLNILSLIKLIQLRSFYPGRHTLECPSLKTFNVFLCEALQIFSFDHLDNSQQKLGVDEVDMPIQQSLFYVDKV